MVAGGSIGGGGLWWWWWYWWWLVQVWWKQWWWWSCVAAALYLSQPALEPTGALPACPYSTLHNFTLLPLHLPLQIPHSASFVFSLFQSNSLHWFTYFSKRILHGAWCIEMVVVVGSNDRQEKEGGWVDQTTYVTAMLSLVPGVWWCMVLWCRMAGVELTKPPAGPQMLFTISWWCQWSSWSW